MNVEILVAGPYARFDPPSGKQSAQNLKVGDVAEFPDVYAESLIDSKLAKATTAKVTVETPEVIFRQDLDSELSLVEQVAASNAERQAKEAEAAKVKAAAKAKAQADKKAAEAKKTEEDNARRHTPWSSQTPEGK
jgi:membrane protein involved in colicin uptake